MACEDNNTYVLTFGERFTEKDEESGTETAYYYAKLSGVDNNAHRHCLQAGFRHLRLGCR